MGNSMNTLPYNMYDIIENMYDITENEETQIQTYQSSRLNCSEACLLILSSSKQDIV